MLNGETNVSYGIGLKCLINSEPKLSSDHVNVFVSICLQSLIQAVQYGKKDIQIEACELLADTMSKFGDKLGPKQDEIINCMFGAMNSDQPALRRRAAHLVIGFLNNHVVQTSVLNFVRQRVGLIMGNSSSDMCPLTISYVKITLICLNGLSQNAERLASKASDILSDFLLGFLLDTNINETLLPRLKVEFGLQCLENLFNARQRTASQSSYLSRFLDPHLNKIIEKLSEFVNYDNLKSSNAMEIEDEDEDGYDLLVDSDDDDYYDEEVEDSSWKVRRGAVRVVDSIIRGYPEKLQRLYALLSYSLVNRLPKETNETTIADIIICLCSFIKATALKNVSTLKLKLEEDMSAPKLLTRLLPKLLFNLTPFLLPSTIKRDKSKTAALRMIPNLHPLCITMINRLATTLPGYLGDHLELIFKMVEQDFNESAERNTWKIDLLKLLVHLVKTHEYATYAKFADQLNSVAIKAISDPFHRIRLEGMEFVQVLVQRRPLHENVNLTGLFPAILSQFNESKNDIDLKIKVLTTMAVFIEHVGQDIPAESILQCLQVYEGYLDVMCLATTAIDGLTRIYGSPTSVKQCLAPQEVTRKLVSMLDCPGTELVVAVLQCLTKICNTFPRDFILNENNSDNVSGILAQLPLFLNSAFPQVQQEALELASVLLKNCAKTDVVQQLKVADSYMQNNFIESVVSLANSNITQPALLTALVHLAQSIGMFSPANHPLSVQFMLTKLGEQISHLTSLEADKDFYEIKDAIPTLSRQKDFPFVKRYLYILIFGDIGSRADISHLGDVFDVLMDHVSLKDCVLSDEYLAKLKEPATPQPMEVQGASPSTSFPTQEPVQKKSPATISDGGFYQLRMLAAESIGQIISGEPEAMVHELLQFFEPDYIADGCTNQNLVHYYLFQTLKQTVVNLVKVRKTEHLFKRIDELWRIIISQAGHKEEGTRDVVAECLGRVTFLQPEELVPRLHREMKSPEIQSSPNIICTYVTAFKFLLSTAASINYPDDPEEDRATVSDIPISLNSSNASLSLLTLKERYSFANLLLKERCFLDIMNLFNHADPDVCRAALLTLNTAEYYWPPIIRSLLKEKRQEQNNGDSETLLDALYRATKVRPELIRTVQIGPFKVDFDDGKDLRKTAFECMSKLLDLYVEYLPISPFLDTLIAGLKDHNYNKIACCHILRKAVQFAPIEIVEKMPQITPSVIEILNMQVKETWVKQEADRLEEVKMNVLDLVLEISTIPDMKNSQMYIDLTRLIQSDNSLRQLWLKATEQNSPTGTK
nr:Cullin associated NEDD8 dissociated protein 1 [Hymenolepis microstoma]